MQKKLLAVAVAGALGAPAVALAQNATVNVYGVMYFEYSAVKQGNTPGNVGNSVAPNTNPGAPLAKTDFLQNPGSAIGFRGEEKLGGGTSVWWQCESSADFRGQGTSGFCSRNSALGVKSGMGNLFGGLWDTPMKRVSSDMIGATQAGGDTGIYGVSNILFGGSTGTNAVTGAAANQPSFRRRQTNLITYDTPNFSGFSASGAVTVGNSATNSLQGASGNKPRIWSLSASYKNGPLNIYGAYERHKDIVGNAPAVPNGIGGYVISAARTASDTGWVVGGSYVFANSLKLGGLYTRQKFEGGTAAAPLDSQVNAWYLAMDWKISGPHGMRASYSRANDVTGTFVAGAQPNAAVPVAGANNNTFPNAIGTTGSSSRPGVGPSTGAQMYIVKYVHTLSKRTEATVGYVKVDNKANANYNLTGLSSNGNGQDQSAFVMTLYHTF